MYLCTTVKSPCIVFLHAAPYMSGYIVRALPGAVLRLFSSRPEAPLGIHLEFSCLLWLIGLDDWPRLRGCLPPRSPLVCSLPRRLRWVTPCSHTLCLPRMSRHTGSCASLRRCIVLSQWLPALSARHRSWLCRLIHGETRVCLFGSLTLLTHNQSGSRRRPHTHFTPFACGSRVFARACVCSLEVCCWHWLKIEHELMQTREKFGGLGVFLGARHVGIVSCWAPLAWGFDFPVVSFGGLYQTCQTTPREVFSQFQTRVVYILPSCDVLARAHLLSLFGFSHAASASDFRCHAHCPLPCRPRLQWHHLTLSVLRSRPPCSAQHVYRL